MNWQPSASLERLKLRAELNHLIRGFFRERGVMEVETPLLSEFTVSEPHLHSWEVPAQRTLYLQTSPEFAMKQLIASGSGPIYQICKAFRHEPNTPRHQPEFTMLEWYRPDWTLNQLVQEISELIQTLRKHFGLPQSPLEQMTYRNAFKRHLGLCPHTASTTLLRQVAQQTINGDFSEWDRETLLDLLMSHQIEPALAAAGTFISEFPATQSALAQQKMSDGIAVADRVELYMNGLEIANAYQELTDSRELMARHKQNCQIRDTLKLPPIPPPSALLQAMQSGLPSSAGVALGVDRLAMVLSGAATISEVIAFPLKTDL